MFRVIRAFGWRGVPLAIANVRGGTRVWMLSVPGSSVRLAARVGRAESDVATIMHVFHFSGYDFVGGFDNGRQVVRSVLDAGANAGYASVWFAQRYPEATVIAIEPDEGNLALLRQNTAHLPQVSVIAAALMAFDGVANMIDPQEGPWAIRVQPGDASWSDGLDRGSVPCVSIPSVLDAAGLDVLDLLKLDIEGSELEVLGDSAAWLPRVNSMVAELHDRFRPGCTEAFAAATVDFATRYERGENVFVTRDR